MQKETTTQQANKSPFWRGIFHLLAIILVVSTGSVTARPINIHQELENYSWVYLRGMEPIETNEHIIELAAFGDTNLGRGVNPSSAFEKMAGWPRSADLSMVNLECAISETRTVEDNFNVANEPHRLIAFPSAADALKKAGIDLAVLANNHTLDAGPDGLNETIMLLRKKGIKTVGAGQDEAAASIPVIEKIGAIKVAFLAFNAIPSPDPAQDGWTEATWNLESIKTVRRAAVAADIVVVSMHWGFEFEHRADSSQLELAQILISAGADLVIGHHPHVMQEIITQQRADGTTGLAALSLGNFVFDQGQEGSAHGLALRAFFDQNGLRAAQIIPLTSGLKPHLSRPSDPIPPVKHIQPPGKYIFYTCTSYHCDEISEQSNDAYSFKGIFKSELIDLTGDRKPEEIRLFDGKVEIYEQDRLTWTSPSEWHILDAATGDPDSDGRIDLMIVMEKIDKEGQVQSHPFLIGYRGGIYRTIWGGSPVRDPVKEVELGDVDGDGEIELIVLEEERSGEGRAVTIWHWHGWGFSLDWRSAYGQLENMVFDGNHIIVNQLTSRYNRTP